MRRAIAHFVVHYHTERNHQGLGGKLIDPEPGVGMHEGPVVRRGRIGGLLNYYFRRAA